MKKVIHCIWLGGPKTPLALKCRASWERFAPDWEIREWNDIPQDAPPFVVEAVSRRKWAFVSDWMRFQILFDEGGVYFDFDEELIAPFKDLPQGEWVATELMKQGEWGYSPGSGLALERGSDIARRMLDYYASASFGTEKTVGDILNEIVGSPQKTSAISALPPSILSAVDWKGRRHFDERTIGFHHYALSWISPRRRLCRWLSWHHCDWLVQLGLKARNIVRK